MLRIGEAAKMYNISNRTLRYWEENGLLESSRAENEYRHYDGENITRINRIVLLRKLRIPIADIERILLPSDPAETPGVVIDVLSRHLKRLREDAGAYRALISAVENILRHIGGSGNAERVFAYLEAHGTDSVPERTKESQNKLSERDNNMASEKLSNVRIVRLPAMTVAAYRAVSTEPERDCGAVHNKFVLENNLHKRDGFRHMGFNNPSPSGGNPVYGYEMWVTIPEDFEVPAPLEKKKFGGGLYASISTDMNEIGERWQALNEWCENSDKYDADFTHQWLEECTMDYEDFISGKDPQLDLLEPIKPRA